MPYKQTDHLLNLIARLSPAEKRHFRLFVRRSAQKRDALFVQLFDHLDKTKDYDEAKILKKIPGIKRGQLSNLKSNLYRQLLASLRLQYKFSKIEINVRELIDYSILLDSKGLHHASLDMLDKAKRIATEYHMHALHLNILELEKRIEGTYITGSMYPKAKELRQETNNLLDRLGVNHRLSNLSLSLYGLYLQYGYVKDDRDFNFVSDYFKDRLPNLHIEDLDFYGRLYYHQSHVWYYNMVQDFANDFRHAQRWVDLYEENPRWKDLELTQYIKGLHNVLNALFMAQRYDKFAPVYGTLLSLGDERIAGMTNDELSMFRLIEFTHGINRYFLTGDFDEGVRYVRQIESFLVENTFGWDLNRILLFNYKIASIYFCYGDLDSTITLLNKITNQVYPSFREDIQCFARILNLIAHFDKGNVALVNHQIKSTYRFLSRMKHLQKALKEILSFLRRIPGIAEEDLRSEFIKLKNRLIRIREERFERRPFLYLDIIAWLEGKIEGKPVKVIIQRNIAAKQA